MQRIKITKVNWYVPNLIKYHINKFGDFDESTTYTEQMKKFYNHFYWPGTGLESELDSRKYHVNNILFAPPSSCNLNGLHKAWAKEFNQNIDDQKVYRNLLKQIVYQQPDILIVQDGYIFGKGFYDYLKNSIPHLKAIFVVCGTTVPQQQLINLKEITAVLSISKEISKQFDSINIPTHILEHAFDINILKHLKSNQKIHKINFMGSVIDEYLGKACHRFRKEVLDNFIRNKTPLDIFTPQANAFPNYKALYAPLFGIEMLQLSQNYLVNLNVHADIAKNSTANVRLYELTGIGSCLLTDKTNDINDFFKEDYEIVTFSSKEEAICKAKYLLENPSEALQIGRRGQERTITMHTYKNRVPKFEKILKLYL